MLLNKTETDKILKKIIYKQQIKTQHQFRGTYRLGRVLFFFFKHTQTYLQGVFNEVINRNPPINWTKMSSNDLQFHNTLISTVNKTLLTVLIVTSPSLSCDWFLLLHFQCTIYVLYASFIWPSQESFLSLKGVR